MYSHPQTKLYEKYLPALDNGVEITDNSEVKNQKDIQAKGRLVILKMVFQKRYINDELVNTVRSFGNR